MCGVVGVYGHEHAGQLAFQVLWLQQHRGRDSFGIKVFNNKRVEGPENHPGEPTENFYQAELQNLEGRIAIGHVRYATAGCKDNDSQPIAYSDIAIGHNGNLTNAVSLRQYLELQGKTFITHGSDTEVILQLVKSSKRENIEDKLTEALEQIKGAYSIVVIAEDKLIAAKDPYGYRPLSIGQFGAAYIIASEEQALRQNGVTNIREIVPGEMVIIDEQGPRSRFIKEKNPLQQCLFELVYFTKPDGMIYGMNHDIAELRYKTGVNLAKQHPVQADVVISVPDSGNHAAHGYAREAGIEFREGLQRSHNAGRTFILANPELRAKGVMIKLSAIGSVLKNKRVAVVDDSIVRGTTSQKYIQMIRKAGAAEVHVRIASPPIMWPCYYGIDTPTKQELIASAMSTEEIRTTIDADSLEYLSLEGLLAPLANRVDFCTACFAGNYADNLDQLVTIGGLKS